MISEEKEFYELIRNLSKGLKRHGLKKVIKALKQINIDNEDEINFSIIDFIENAVCTKIGVPKDELFGFASRGEITIARKFCILLIRKYISNISDEELGNHFNRSRQVVHNTEREFKMLKNGKNNKFHIDFLAIYDDLDIQTGKFINILKKVK
jgi:chromosomal replication initiation ATPase DnaA